MASAAAGSAKLGVFLAIYFAYVFYYVCCKNYGMFLGPLMVSLHASKGQAGLIGSAWQLSSGFCKVFGGILVDSYPPKMILAGALLCTALCNVVFGLLASRSSTPDAVPVLAVIWGLSGAFQSLGWPALAKIYMRTFTDPAERGTMYSVLSTNQNVGSTIVPFVLVPTLAWAGAAGETEWSVLESLRVWMGWRVALFLPAFASSAYAIFLLVLLPADPPQTKRAAEEMNKRLLRTGVGSAAQAKVGPSMSTLIVQAALDPGMMQLSLCYFFITLVRTFVGDWSLTFLTESRGVPQSGSNVVASCIFLLELGSSLGGVVAGTLSDKMFAGRRGPVIALFSVATALPSLFLLASMPGVLRDWNSDFVTGYLPLSAPSFALEMFSFFLIGFFAFPPHMLCGLAARELAPDARVTATAAGFVKLAGQIGGACAGAPLGYLISEFGWRAAVTMLVFASIAAFMSTVGLWNATGRDRKHKKSQ